MQWKELGYELFATINSKSRLVACVEPHVDRFRTWDVNGWFWYGGSYELGVPMRNTSEEGIMYATAIEAKVACMAYVKGRLARAEKGAEP